jgi:hypothetical protein
MHYGMSFSTRKHEQTCMARSRDQRVRPFLRRRLACQPIFWVEAYLRAQLAFRSSFCMLARTILKVEELQMHPRWASGALRWWVEREKGRLASPWRQEQQQGCHLQEALQVGDRQTRRLEPQVQLAQDKYTG